ncbi:threonine/serine ThrE exporter family protein [Brevibacterium luteolum]|uniref:threonine/serine ThrE exporter family protein n=1 Tax=Brevibacterium luteolum TaxID=199591 RepID=UPI00223B825A|nr:threonine/serine exporter family protein [Brevibacterium luteolum]MCT1920445.1 threonine/serine exporter family protein [Brevibacterium luteolum]
MAEDSDRPPRRRLLRPRIRSNGSRAAAGDGARHNSHESEAARRAGAERQTGTSDLGADASQPLNTNEYTGSTAGAALRTTGGIPQETVAEATEKAQTARRRGHKQLKTRAPRGRNGRRAGSASAASPATASGTATTPATSRLEQDPVDPSEALTPPVARGADGSYGTGRSSSTQRFRRNGSSRSIVEKTNAAGSSSKRMAERLARKAVGQITGDSMPATDPIPIVATLKGTPYQAPVQSQAKGEEEARKIMELAVDIGWIMLRAGAPTADVEVSVIATCTALGLPTVEVDLTSNSLNVHYSDPEGRLLNVMRVSREESIHYSKLASVHKLVTDIVDGKVEYLEASERIDAIRQQRRPFAGWFVALAWGMLVTCFVLLLGGSAVSAVIGFGMAIIIDRFGALLARFDVPPFFTAMGQSTFATVLAMAAWTFGFIAAPQYLVAAGIVLLLPTAGLIAAVQDSLTNFPLTASAKAVTVGTTLAGIVSGIALGIMVGRAIGLSPIEVIVTSGGVEALTTIISLIAAILVGMCGAIGMQAAKRQILIAGLIGGVGFVIYVGCTLLGLGNVVTCFIAATVVGLIVRPVALHRGAPPIVLLLPGIFPLLQGLSIFSAAYQIVQPQDAIPLSMGLSSLFTAVTANAAIAVGAVFGDFLARPIHQRVKDRREKSDAVADATAGAHPTSTSGTGQVSS